MHCSGIRATCCKVDALHGAEVLQEDCISRDTFAYTTVPLMLFVKLLLLVLVRLSRLSKREVETKALMNNDESTPTADCT